MNPIVISFVGPTSAGKTSVIRTFTDSFDFGQVGPGPTTTEVQRKKVFVFGVEMIHLCDTPGFQASPNICQRLDGVHQGGILDDIIKTAKELAPNGIMANWYSP